MPPTPQITHELKVSRPPSSRGIYDLRDSTSSGIFTLSNAGLPLFDMQFELRRCDYNRYQIVTLDGQYGLSWSAPGAMAVSLWPFNGEIEQSACPQTWEFRPTLDGTGRWYLVSHWREMHGVTGEETTERNGDIVRINTETDVLALREGDPVAWTCEPKMWPGGEGWKWNDPMKEKKQKFRESIL